MEYLLIRQRFTDYDTWRAAFDELGEVRSAAGMRTVLVTVDAEQPEEAVVLFECDDAQAMRRHFASDALKEAHRKAGVVPGSNQASVLIPR
ncbi:heme-degrading monooxygenase HmoA [Nonomuraea thailandensis]|uniref:Heme-degrading monooxygenase HmoA n=1 Tax=Nonomuraea thailandensis TaxID=1188745 RepID=A0A9X2K991_9ACTN|nr:antibiotic biosynthesis monooxygenase [Nonomuraea thailandensis]MCP2364374.1 heme-degrading monooxygenase HmoA [Nonomuraea thailandensis]